MDEQRYTPTADDTRELWLLNYLEFAKREGGGGGGAQKAHSLWWALACQDPVGLAERSPLMGAFLGNEACWERAKAEAAKTAGARKSDRSWHLGGEPNQAQWAAIDAALSNPITFIQGPPGTGKTATIVNLLYQLYLLGQKNGEPMQVAVISSNAAALQNIHDKLEELKGKGQDGGLAELVAPLGNANKRIAFGKTQKKVVFRNERVYYWQDGKNAEVHEEHPPEGTKEPHKWNWLAGQEKNWCELHSHGTLQSVQREQTLTVDQFFDAGFAAFTSTAHSLPNCFRDGVFHQYDYVIVDEASQMSILTGLVAMGHARRLILVGDEQQLAPVINASAIGQLDEWGRLIKERFSLVEPWEEEMLQQEQEELEACLREHPEWMEEDGLTPEERAAQRDDIISCEQALDEEYRTFTGYGIYQDRSFLDLCLDVFLGHLPSVRDGDGPYFRTGGLAGPEREKYKVFLNRHYRCHPGIIGFCNEAVYRPVGTPMEVCTRRYDADITVPIRIVEFQGDYCEHMLRTGTKNKQKAENRQSDWQRRAELVRRRNEMLPPDPLSVKENRKPMNSKHNARQAELFMALEWPRLKEELVRDPSLTVCILSPFRGQLTMLEEIIRTANREDPVSVKWQSIGAEEADAKGSLPRSAGADEGSVQPGRKDALVLRSLKGGTIHKSQGQEFDIVYLLPVEDSQWEWPFSQKKRMINVAVSRAKKELRVILSRGCVDDPGPDGSVKQDEGQMYLRKLRRYVERNATEEDREKGFGLQSSPLCSIFDNKKDFEPVRTREEGSSAPEHLVSALLREVTSALDLPWKVEKRRGVKVSPKGGDYQEVPVTRVVQDLHKDSGGTHEYLKKLLGQMKAEDGTGITQDDLEFFLDFMEDTETPQPRFDFVLRDETGRPFLIIEVDGEVHRFPWYNPEKPLQETYPEWLEKDWLHDRLKERLVELMGGDVYYGNHREGAWNEKETEHGAFALLRLPDDGSTCLETDALRADATNEKLRERYFTLEDLIRRYRPRPAGREGGSE